MPDPVSVDSPVLSWLLQGEPGPPSAAQSRRGWGVIVAGDVYAIGLRGRVLRRLRSRRQQLAATPPQRLCDLAASLGVEVSGDARLAKSGTVLVEATHATGPALLRIAPGHLDAALFHAADAQALLADAVEVVPATLGRTRLGAVAATAEARLPGRRPERLTVSLVSQVATALRRSGELLTGEDRISDQGPDRPMAGSVVLRSNVDTILEACAPGTHIDVVHRLARAAAIVLDDAVAGLQHGDLWHQNLLVHRGQLSGLVDWDSWTPQGLVGVDLVGLVSAWDRLRAGLTVGQAVARRTWRGRAAELVALGVPEEHLDALGIAWWLGSVAGTLQRVPERASDRAWIDAAIMRAQDATAWLAPQSD